MTTDPFPIRFTILGPPCSWKNSKRMVTKPFPKLLPSEKSELWMGRAIPQLVRQWAYKPIPKSFDLNAAIVSYMPFPPTNDKEERHGWTLDADNLLGGPGDAMQAAGILEDDVCICSFDGSRRRYDKANPRVEIELMPAARNPGELHRWASDAYIAIKQSDYGDCSEYCECRWCELLSRYSSAVTNLKLEFDPARAEQEF